MKVFRVSIRICYGIGCHGNILQCSIYGLNGYEMIEKLCETMTKCLDRAKTCLCRAMKLMIHI